MEVAFPLALVMEAPSAKFVVPDGVSQTDLLASPVERIPIVAEPVTNTLAGRT